MAEARSFSNAAREIHLSQSAVSKHIARLETECGVRLVARRGVTSNVRRPECPATQSTRDRESNGGTQGLDSRRDSGRDPDCISREPSAGSQMV